METAGRTPAKLEAPEIRLLEQTAVSAGGIEPEDPGELMRICANCGAAMDERKCKLVCGCGYFLSCSDYY